MKVHLKIKLASLAAESRIIRKEERKHRNYARYLRRNGKEDNDAAYTADTLQGHRTGVVRCEARASGLAYGFLRGRAYKQLEAKCNIPPSWARVQKVIERFGEGDKSELIKRFEKWQKVE